MKALLILLVTCFSTAFALAQETPVKPPKTKKITAKTFFCTERYAVLRDNPSVKHGMYKVAGKSPWRVTGQYSHGNPAGIWSYYGTDGQLERQYNFDNHSYLRKSKASSFGKRMAILTDEGFVETTTAQEPFFITGDGGVFSVIASNIKYPRDAINAGIAGEVLISAEITETGEMVNEQVAKSLFESTDKEALRVLQLVPDQWVPARIDGKLVRSRIFIPVKYTIK